jgi:hypothetical protein
MLMRARNLRHGDAQRGQVAPEYRVWSGMLARCRNSRNKDFPRYGARGIRVWADWAVFETFIYDLEQEIGRRPSPQHSLDRINNDGHYEPGNIRWATVSEQARNRRPRSRVRIA